MADRGGRATIALQRVADVDLKAIVLISSSTTNQISNWGLRESEERREKREERRENRSKQMRGEWEGEVKILQENERSLGVRVLKLERVETYEYKKKKNGKRAS